MIFSLDMPGNSFISTREVATPSNVPNCESMPSVNSIRKNSTAQNWAPGNWLIASVNMMNANPVPEALCKYLRNYNIILNEKYIENTVFRTDITDLI